MFTRNAKENLKRINHGWPTTGQADAAWIGLGSNVGAPAETLDSAIAALSRLSEQSVYQSRRYYSPPWGVTEQPIFLNQVVGILPHAHLSPEELLNELLQIELDHGRVRAQRWGPRTLDLDLLAWGARVKHSPTLTLPHPRLAERRFVLQPWCELAPELRLPEHNFNLRELLQRCPDQGELWESEGEKAKRSPR